MLSLFRYNPADSIMLWLVEYSRSVIPSLFQLILFYHSSSPVRVLTTTLHQLTRYLNMIPVEEKRIRGTPAFCE
jgi:hypothetical protein